MANTVFASLDKARTKASILAILRLASHGLRTSAIRRRLGDVGERSVQRYLRELHEAGMVQRHGGRCSYRWTLTEDGLSYLTAR